MVVEAQVSSMKTRRAGSRSSWPSNQASRRHTADSDEAGRSFRFDVGRGSGVMSDAAPI